MWEAAGGKRIGLDVAFSEWEEGTPFAFSADGRMLAIFRDNKTPREVDFYELGSRKKFGPLFSRGLSKDILEQKVTALAFSPDGKNLAVTTTRSVQLWNLTKQMRPAQADAPAKK